MPDTILQDSAAHTAGPWRLDVSSPSTRVLAGDFKIVLVNGYGAPPSEWLANARLIAAAPALLAACRAAAQWMCGDVDGLAAPVVDDLHAALAKAEGAR